MKKGIQISLIMGLLFIFGCGGGNPFVPGPEVTNEELVGSWQGTYQNDVVGTGVIELTFFMDAGSLKVTYELQGGEVSGTSSVSKTGRVISFIGPGTALTKFDGDVRFPATKITGVLLLNYTLYPDESGPVTLNKI